MELTRDSTEGTPGGRGPHIVADDVAGWMGAEGTWLEDWGHKVLEEAWMDRWEQARHVQIAR